MSILDAARLRACASRFAKLMLALTVLFAGSYLGMQVHAQRPPETDASGAAYLRVNINPTDVPPMVNINPDQFVPRVEVTRMPEIRIPAPGCQLRQNFQTGIGRAISGPLMITYLHLPPQATATLADASGSRSMDVGQAGQITTAIYLQPGQSLNFNADVMYSGCRPD
jgi:hypothetical protein